MIRQILEMVKKTRRLRNRCKLCPVGIHHRAPPATQWITTDSVLRSFVTNIFTRLPWGRRGHRFVRYADDCNIYVRSERAGQRVMESTTSFIMQKLKLKVNEAKSAVARPQERKFLGFSFTAGPEVKRVIAPKALGRFKRRIREITRRAKGVSMETTMEELVPYMRGWRNYFGYCETPVVLQYLTRWVRLRLRAALWRQWKTQRRRRAALIRLGVSERLASNTAGSGRGPWYLARSRALSVGLSNAYFRSLGLPSLVEEC
jgi:RNA-directed DNA polymerase